MDIKEDRRGNSVILRLSGDLDATSAFEISSKVRIHFDDKRERVVLDMSDVGYVNSAGLGSLVSLTKRADSQGVQLIIAALRPDVEKIVKETRIDSIIKICPTVEGALSS
ncbi:MAG: STAS domain-containing protein [bacterium]